MAAKYGLPDMGGGRRRKEEIARRRRRRRFVRAGLLVAGAAAVVAGGLLAVDPFGGGGTDGTQDLRLVRQQSALLDRSPEPPAFAEPPAQFRIEYRVRYASGTTNTERAWFRRPFDSRVETFIGGPARGQPSQVQEARFGVLGTRSAGDPARVIAVPPAAAASDVRADAGADAAVAAGLAERRERRLVAGRECQVYRGGGSVVGGALRPPTAEEYTDVCIDDESLLLESWQVSAGRPLVQRVAVDVRVGDRAGVSDATFRLPASPTVEADEGGGVVSRVEPGTAPEGPAYAVGEPPDGFVFDGRWAVVAAQAALADPLRQGESVAGLTDVWRRGIDFVAVEQGGRLDASDPFSYGDDAVMVELSPLAPEGELRHSLAAPEVRVLLGDGRFVRVYGTVDPDVLVAVARSVRPVEGTGLSPL